MRSLPPTDRCLRPLLTGALVVLFFIASGCQDTDNETSSRIVPADTFSGRWELVASESSAIDPWNDLHLDLSATASRIRLIRTWQGSHGYSLADSLDIPVDGTTHRVPLDQWPDNRHIGAFARTSRPRRVRAEWLDDGRTLQTTTNLWVEVSQGTRQIRTYTEYRLAPGGDRLFVIELRSTRPRARRYVFDRVEPPTSASY